MNENISAYIMAGGKSKRFGKDKLIYNYKGKPLIEHVIDVLKPIFKKVYIITNDNEKLSYLNLPIYSDIIQGLGPMGGILTALSYSETELVFCFAGDTPNINSDFIRYMISISDQHDIIVPHFEKYYEALHAIYRKSCIPVIKDYISRGNYKIIDMYSEVDTRLVEKDEIVKYSDVYMLFKNINYIDDLE